MASSSDEISLVTLKIPCIRRFCSMKEPGLQPLDIGKDCLEKVDRQKGDDMKVE